VADEEREVEYGISDFLLIILKFLDIPKPNDLALMAFLKGGLTAIQEMLKLVRWDYYIGSAEGHEYPNLQVGDEVNPRCFLR
jgi:hypothetical protein